MLSLGDQEGDSLTAALVSLPRAWLMGLRILLPPPGDMTEGARVKDRNEGDLVILAWVVAAAISPLVLDFGEVVGDQPGRCEATEGEAGDEVVGKAAPVLASSRLAMEFDGCGGFWCGREADLKAKL